MAFKIARKIWLDGKLVDWQKAKISVLSQSLQRGSAIFESMSLYEEEVPAKAPAKNKKK